MDHTYTDAEDWVEIYHTGSMVDATRILDAVLRPAGIDAVLHDRMSHAMPAPASEPGVLAIAVREKDRARAQQLIREDLVATSEVTTVE